MAVNLKTIQDTVDPAQACGFNCKLTCKLSVILNQPSNVGYVFKKCFLKEASHVVVVGCQNKCEVTRHYAYYT